MIIQICFIGVIMIVSICYVDYVLPIIIKYISYQTYNIFFTNILILVQLDNFNLLNELTNLKIKINEILLVNKVKNKQLIKKNDILKRINSSLF